MNGLVLDGPKINPAQSNAMNEVNNTTNSSSPATGINANDASVNYQPLNLESDVVRSAETLAFDLTASANSATQMAQLFLELVQSLRDAAEIRAEIVIQQMESQVDVKREMADTILSEAKKAKEKGDDAVTAQRVAAGLSIAGAAFGAATGGATKIMGGGVQGAAAISSLVTTGSGGTAGFANAEASNMSNKVTEIQEKSKAQQTDDDAEAQMAATLQQRAANWESSLNDIQNALLSLAKELFAQEPNTARSMGNNI